MARIQISNDSSGRIIVSFPYDPLLVTKVKTINGRKWHPVEKYWSFPNTDETLEKILKVFGDENIQIDPFSEGDCPRLRRERSVERFTDSLHIPSPSMGEGEGGGEEVRTGTVPEVLDNLNLEGGDIDNI